jgi:hypothetical protein
MTDQLALPWDAGQPPPAKQRRRRRAEPTRADDTKMAASQEIRPPRDREVTTSRQTTLRLPEPLAIEAEAVARVLGMSINALIVAALTAELRRLRADDDFQTLARVALERDRVALERIGQ